MKTRQANPLDALPLIVEPSSDREATANHLLEWIEDSLDEVQSILLQNGGVVFRGFHPQSPEILEGLIDIITPGAMNYVGGNLPKERVSGKVYKSACSSSSKRITLHNELSNTNHWPKRIAFLCKVPAVSGGETPIVDCRKILKSLPPRIVEEFREKGITYIQNLHSGTGLGRSWQSAFETEDSSMVSEMLKNEGAEYDWIAGGILRIYHNHMALKEHYATRELLWFNQAEQWHSSCFNHETRKILNKKLDPIRFPYNVLFGDGSPISDEDAIAIREISWALAVSEPWQSGDIMLLDNMYVAHGRKPFDGPREVYVAMG